VSRLVHSYALQCDIVKVVCSPVISESAWQSTISPHRPPELLYLKHSFALNTLCFHIKVYECKLKTILPLSGACFSTQKFAGYFHK